jgi:hypothetical protein
MPTPSRQTPSRPAARIDIANPQELLAWAERLDVPPALVSDTVVQVGDDPEAVALVLTGSAEAAHRMH